MKDYWMEVSKDSHGKWMVEVKCNSDILVCYGQIDSQDDAHLVGEAFIDGIKLIEGE
jgi:hypothetical protein